MAHARLLHVAALMCSDVFGSGFVNLRSKLKRARCAHLWVFTTVASVGRNQKSAAPPCASHGDGANDQAIHAHTTHTCKHARTAPWLNTISTPMPCTLWFDVCGESVCACAVLRGIRRASRLTNARAMPSSGQSHDDVNRQASIRTSTR